MEVEPKVQEEYIPEVNVGMAGDPFVARARHQDEECRSCYGTGYNFLGYVVESAHDLSGEEVIYKRVPCRRCRS
jgi:hypothetical protein